jgi:hypothetical protein
VGGALTAPLIDWLLPGSSDEPHTKPTTTETVFSALSFPTNEAEADDPADADNAAEPLLLPTNVSVPPEGEAAEWRRIRVKQVCSSESSQP